ncbi:MAG: sugar phosphate isomerase/epimerase family protein [Myxococcota bacterium]
MARLVYDTINDSPYVTGRAPRLLEQIEAAADAGFQGIGIDVWSIDRFRELGGTLDALRSALDRRGLPCIELQAFVFTDDVDETARNARNIAEIAEVLRPEILMSGTHVPVDDAVVANLARFAPTVTASGARLAIEFLPMMPIDTIAKTRDLIARAGLAPGTAGVCLDVWHFAHGPDDWPDLDALPPSELAYVQFSDHPRLASDDLNDETLNRRVVPGQGVLPLARFVEAVRAKRYAGPVAAEVLSTELRALTPAEAARRVYAATAPFWRSEAEARRTTH